MKLSIQLCIASHKLRVQTVRCELEQLRLIGDSRLIEITERHLVELEKLSAEMDAWKREHSS